MMIRLAEVLFGCYSFYTFFDTENEVRGILSQRATITNKSLFDHPEVFMKRSILHWPAVLGASVLVSCFLLSSISASAKPAKDSNFSIKSLTEALENNPASDTCRDATSCAPIAETVVANQDNKQHQKKKEKIEKEKTLTGRERERVIYQQAKQALNSGNKSSYQNLVTELKSYPLLPYLEYQELSSRLTALPKEDVQQFFMQYPNSFLADRLTHRWLRTLAQKERWADYLAFYDTSLNDPELQCLQIRARLATNDSSALNDVAPLWNIGTAQSKACDPVFAEWRKAGLMTPDLIWERHLKALIEENRGLVSYLTSISSDQEKPLLGLLQQVDHNPRLLKQTSKFSQQSPRMQAIILHGLSKLARTKAKEALSLWQGYDAQQLFNTQSRNEFKYQLALRLLNQDYETEAENLVASTPDLTGLDLFEALIRESLRRQDWERVNEWLLRLPDEERNSERWLYWLARTMEELRIKEQDGKSAQQIYASLAPQRSFYGFMAADKTSINYHLLDRPMTFTDEQISAVENMPGVARTMEFFALNDLDSANREWTHTTRQMSVEQLVILGKVAKKSGRYYHGIRAMAEAEYWDDLEVRFPIAYKELVANAAKQTSVNPLFIFAIARQESAFLHNAKSPSGALGLMQLMPATAKQTAKTNGLNIKLDDLFTPETNIALGSRYLDHLLGVFNGNRILAAAAYNAGPHRVQKWLNKNAESSLPYDVWIETIPYKETRGYVQNVLFFSLIYAYRLGQESRFVTPDEASRFL
jgi:soluble lytic murein transglycosylase